jgi:uncharacterized protein DUF5681
MSDTKDHNVMPLPHLSAVGYKRPPIHTRFKPGQSGNPSGRAKGSQNLKTLCHKIMKEEVPHSCMKSNGLRFFTPHHLIKKCPAFARG